VKAIDEIILASDGVMVARGDLAVEIGDAEVPMVQKHIIQRARTLDRPVIIATQMMESMIVNAVPTRAEVSDVANAVLDNVDVVMCSAETATGAFPVETIESKDRVCRVVEKQPTTQKSKHRVECQFARIDEAIAMATIYTANHFDMRAVVALTESGATPLWMSRIRTGLPIYGLSRFARTLGKMTLYRGVYPIYFDVTQCTRDELNRTAISLMEDKGLLQKGDRVILTKGDHLGRSGGSNAMKILVVGDVM
jgi:pyruvate kinase